MKKMFKSIGLVSVVAVLSMLITGCTLSGKLPFEVDQKVSIPVASKVSFVTPSDAPGYVYGVKLDPSKLFTANQVEDKSVLTGPWYIVCGATYAGYTNTLPVLVITNEIVITNKTVR